jgi:hypothetical protein
MGLYLFSIKKKEKHLMALFLPFFPLQSGYMEKQPNDDEVEKYFLSMIPRGSTFIPWAYLYEETRQWWREQYKKRYDNVMNS